MYQGRQYHEWFGHSMMSKEDGGSTCVLVCLFKKMSHAMSLVQHRGTN